MKRTAAEAIQGEIAAATKAHDRAVALAKSADDAVSAALARQAAAKRAVRDETEHVRRAEAALAALIPLPVATDEITKGEVVDVPADPQKGAKDAADGGAL